MESKLNPVRLTILYFLIFAFLLSCTTKRVISPWDFIDSKSVLIAELNSKKYFLEDQLLKTFFKDVSNYLAVVQYKSKKDFDLLFTTTFSEWKFDSLLHSNDWLNKDKRVVNRIFNGVTIYDVVDTKGSVILSFTYINGIILISKSSLLVENAIRIYKSENKSSFVTDNPTLFNFTLLKSDAGNLFINASETLRLNEASYELITSIPIIKKLAGISALDIKVDKDSYLFNGFTLGNDPCLKFFQDQTPIEFSTLRFIPGNVNSVIHYGISNSASLDNAIDSALLNKIGFVDELSLLKFESKNWGAIIKVSNKFDTKSLEQNDNSEIYSDYLIFQLKGEIIKRAFKDLIPMVEFNYAAIRDGYLFISPTIVELKLLIDSIETENTWGKTIEFQKFYSRALQEDNVSIFFKNWQLIPNDFSIQNEYSYLFDSLHLEKLKWGSIQYSALDNNFYSSINLEWAESEMNESNSFKPNTSKSLGTGTNISSFDVVKNHTTGGTELLTQDGSNFIYLISDKSAVLWKRELDGKITGLKQIDFYKNGKLQYLISTDHSIYLIDRLGRNVTGFPKQFSEVILSSSVIDYDKSKNYRYLIATNNVSYHLLDKEGKNLDDWGPKKLSSKAEFPPEHYRIGGRDYFVIIGTDLTVNVISRRSEVLKQFKLDNAPSGDYFIKTDTDLKKSLLHIIDKTGLIVTYNLQGEKLASENLVRGNNSTFYLNVGRDNRNFYYTRIDSDKIAFFNSDGKLIFEKTNPGSSNLRATVFECNSNFTLFSLYDDEQKMYYLFNQSGAEVSIPGLSDLPPVFSMNKSGNQVCVYSAPDKSINVSCIPLVAQ